MAIEIKGGLKDKEVILAPLAGITHWPFRQLVRELGGKITYSEMISSQGLFRNKEKTLTLACPGPGEIDLAVQIFGSEPAVMAEAAKKAEDLGASMIDINMGCPQKKVIKIGAGAALMKEPDRAAKIVEKVKKSVAVPVSCKIRLGWDENSINCVEFAKGLQRAGADLLAVHARTRSQMFGGTARWKEIRRVKEVLEIPVIANGDIRSVEDASRCLQITKADGVMIGRAAMTMPWIIGHVREYLISGTKLKEPDVSFRLEVARRFLRLFNTWGPYKGKVPVAKQHLGWLIRGLLNSSKFRKKLNSLKSMAEISEALEVYASSLSAT